MTWTPQGAIVGAASDKIGGSTAIGAIRAGTEYLPVLGDIIVVQLALDNQDTTQGVDSSLVTSVTDSKGNTYTKLREYTAGRGTALAGTTCSLWACLNVTVAWAGSDSLSATHGSTTARVMRGCAFTPTNANGGTKDATTNAAVGIAADPASMTLTPSGGSREYLWLYALAAEGPNGDTDTVDSTNGWTRTWHNGTTGGGAASNQDMSLGWKVTTASSATVDWTHTAEDYAQIIVAITENAAVGGGGKAIPAGNRRRKLATLMAA